MRTCCISPDVATDAAVSSCAMACAMNSNNTSMHESKATTLTMPESNICTIYKFMKEFMKGHVKSVVEMKWANCQINGTGPTAYCIY